MDPVALVAAPKKGRAPIQAVRLVLGCRNCGNNETVVLLNSLPQYRHDCYVCGRAMTTSEFSYLHGDTDPAA